MSETPSIFLGGNGCHGHAGCTGEPLRPRDWACYAAWVPVELRLASPSDIWTSHTLAWCWRGFGCFA